MLRAFDAVGECIHARAEAGSRLFAVRQWSLSASDEAAHMLRLY